MSILAPVVSVNIMGGLGNQLFQVASAYAYARKHGGNFQILHKTYNGNRPLYFGSILQRFQKYIVYSLPNNLEHWYEEYSTKFYDLGELKPPGKYFNGYLQSSKYFYNDEIKQEIRDLIKPDDNTLNLVKDKYNYLWKNKERVVVMHCRRTDYILASLVHGPLNGDYYKQAIDIMLTKISNPIFLLCGDDNNYWNEISTHISKIYNYEWYCMPPETDINTFILLQQFNNYVIANSTYIWWAAWLANAQNVIAPSKWFGPAGPKYYEDIYEENWIRI